MEHVGQAAGLPELVAYNTRMVSSAHMEELTAQLSSGIMADPPLDQEEILSAAMQKKQEWDLPDSEIIKVSPLPCAPVLQGMVLASPCMQHGCEPMYLAQSLSGSWAALQALLQACTPLMQGMAGMLPCCGPGLASCLS